MIFPISERIIDTILRCSTRRRIAGLKPSEIRSLGREELDVPVTMEDFKEAVKKCKKNVSSEDLEKYKVEMGFRVPSRVKKREVEYLCD